MECGSPQNFTDLVQRALNNDQEAISQLYLMTYNNVYQTIRGMVDFDEDTVFDLIQETYIKAFCNLSQLNNPESFRAWIKTIARNITIDYFRKKNTIAFSQMVTMDSDEEIEFEDNRNEYKPEIVVDQKVTSELLGEILGQLSEEQRIVIYMYYYEELSVKEIGEILYVSEGTVKSRLNYGRKKIEAGVKDLEKKGTKLYGLAPLPFLLALFGSQEAHAAEIPNAMVLEVIQKRIISVGTNSFDSCSTATATKKIGNKMVKEAAHTAGRSILTKVIVGVTSAAIMGAGVMGISSVNQKKDLSMEHEAISQDMKMEEFLGAYTNDKYLFELYYVDGGVSIATSPQPGKSILTYPYEGIQIEGNILKAKHTDCSEASMVNEDGSLTYVQTDGIDTFVMNDDNTITATFAGYNESGNGTYNLYEGEKSVFEYSTEETMLESFLGQYTDGCFYCFELSCEEGILSVKSSVLPGKESEVSDYFTSANALDTITYNYDSFQMDENTLLAYHTEHGENYEGNNVDESSIYDTFVINEDGSLTACFEGTIVERFATYGPYGE